MPIQAPLTQQIIGFRHRFANTLGHGSVEKVFENALVFRSGAEVATKRKGLAPTRPTSLLKDM